MYRLIKTVEKYDEIMNDLELTADRIIMRDLGNNIYFTMDHLMLVEDTITKKPIWGFVSASNRIFIVPNTCSLYNILKLGMI